MKASKHKDSLRQQRRQLRIIQAIAASQYRTHPSGWPSPITGNPAFDRAKAAFTLAAVLVLLIAFLLKLPALAGITLAIFLPGFFACLTYKRYPYRIRSQQLYSLLDAYDPVNQAAYQELQAKDRNQILYWEDILKWAYVEQNTLAQFSAPTTRTGDAERSRFLRKFDSRK
jgi:hypothetical protein